MTPPPPQPSSPGPPTYVARTPVDLIALVPFLLGFHPTDSVVLLTFGGPGSFHARVDLPEGPVDQAETVRVLCGAVRRNAAATVAVLVFGEDDARARSLCADLVPALQRAGADVVDAVRADGHRWWCVGPDPDADADADDPDLVPQSGPGRAYDLSSHPFTAARVLAGDAAFPDRAALAASLLPGHTPAAQRDRDEVRRAAERCADDLLRTPGGAAGTAAAQRHLAASAQWLVVQVARLTAEDQADPCPTPEVAARLALLVALPGMREVVGTTLDRTHAFAQVRLWRDLVRRVPDDLVPGVAAVLALAAWLSGDGALAWCAIDRCHDRSGDDEVGRRAGRGLATYVGGLLGSATSPDEWRGVPAAEVPLLQLPGQRAVRGAQRGRRRGGRSPVPRQRDGERGGGPP